MANQTLFLPPASPDFCPACRKFPVRTDWQLCPACSDRVGDDEAQDLREAAKREYQARVDFDRAAEDAAWEESERAARLADYSDAELAAFREDPSEPEGRCVFCRGTTRVRLLAQPCCDACQRDASARLGALLGGRRADVVDVLERFGRISFAWCATDHCSELADVRAKAEALLEVLS